jgi:ABC-2 type transport system ATP-binding protein
MEEAATLCDEVALLNEGKIVERGAPDEICRRYNHQKKIDIHLTSGEDIELDHKAGSAEMITRWLEQGMLETIHSSEPTLESVFLELTGRKLDQEEEEMYA